MARREGQNRRRKMKHVRLMPMARDATGEVAFFTMPAREQTEADDASVTRRYPQLFYLVLEGQLASLEFHDIKIVIRGMQQRLVDFALQIAVLPFQLCKMGCKRHDRLSLRGSSIAPPPSVHRRPSSVTAQ